MSQSGTSFEEALTAHGLAQTTSIPPSPRGTRSKPAFTTPASSSSNSNLSSSSSTGNNIINNNTNNNEQSILPMTTPLRPDGSPVQKMYALGERFTGIYSDLEQAAVHRREVEENKLHLLREGVVKLEKSLNSEIKRRQEADKAVQTMVDSRLNALEAKVDASFKELNQAMLAGIEVLTRRVGLVEKEIAAEKESRPKDMESSTTEILGHLEVLQNAVELEKIGRLEQQSEILKKNEEAIAAIREQLRSSDQAKEMGIQEVKRSIEKESEEKARAEENFRRMVLEEIRNLKNAIQVETQIREGSEEQIVRAVGDVIIRLQEGMHLLSRA